MHNEISGELNFNELDQVAGGGPIEWLLGYLAGKALDALSHAKDSTPTNVLNGALAAIGKPPIT
jgi:hypothetical protein